MTITSVEEGKCHEIQAGLGKSSFGRISCQLFDVPTPWPKLKHRTYSSHLLFQPLFSKSSTLCWNHCGLCICSRYTRLNSNPSSHMKPFLTLWSQGLFGFSYLFIYLDYFLKKHLIYFLISSVIFGWRYLSCFHFRLKGLWGQGCCKLLNSTPI